MKTELDLYIEWNKIYDKAISKLIKTSNKKSLDKTKEETQKLASEYLGKVSQKQYIDSINKNIKTINERF